MQPSMTCRLLSPAIAIGLLCCSMGAHAATGARVLLQTWNPLAPDQGNVVPLLDQPSLVSDSLQDAWRQLRPRICEQLRLKMGLGGAAGGQTLRDIDCRLDEQVTFNIVRAGLNKLHATFAVSGYIEATSTTPDIAFGQGLPSGTDPRFSVALTAKLDLALAVQADRDHTLRVSSAKFTLGNATLDSHNFSGDILEFLVDDLVPFFGGPDYKNMAESAINAISADMGNDFNAALAPVNAQLRGPPDAVRVGVSGKSDYISVAFAPREVTPPTNGSMTGLLRWDPTQFTPRNGCQSFLVAATVQTGPVPMFAYAATAPTREMGVFHASPVDASTCAFTLSGLAAGWPNTLATKVLDPPVAETSGTANDRKSYGLVSDGWDGRMVIPQPVASARNYKVLTYKLKMANLETLKAAYKRKTDPVNFETNPVDHSAQANPSSVLTGPARASNDVIRNVDQKTSMTTGAKVTGTALSRRRAPATTLQPATAPAVIDAGQIANPQH